MLRLNRWIAATLAACLLMNTIPVYAFEETDESISTVETTSEITQTTQISQETQQETHIQETEPQEETPQETDETVLQETDEEITPLNLEEEGIELAAEGDIPNIGDIFADAFIEVLNDNNISTTITKGEDGIITLIIGQGQGEILALLSQQQQTEESNYQNWNIEFDFTGELPLPDTFKGLGDWGETAESQFPFKGKFTGKAITIVSSKTIFKALHARADLNNNQIQWKIPDTANTPTIPILTNVLVADEEGHTINMSLSSANRFNPYIGQLIEGAGQISLLPLNYSDVGTSPAVEYTEDVGLVCYSMDDNTNLQVGEVTLPSSVLLNLKSSGNVGGLVGSMAEGAKLTIADNLTLNATLNGANTGGLVGSMTNATIDGEEGKTVTVNVTLTATGAAGGISGAVTTAAGLLGGNGNVVLQSVKANGTENSGVLYGTCTATGAFQPLTGVSFGENAVREVSGEKNCGGLFGTLTLAEKGKCTISDSDGQMLEISTSLTSSTNTTSYGGVVGTLTGVRANALVVDNCNIISDIKVGTDKVNYPQYLGGIVAKQDAATLDAKNSTITINSPKTITAADCGFGGVTAYLDDNTLLIADGMKVITDSYSANPGGGGVVGSSHNGSIVYLKNSLDLSKCQLFTNATSGQIVGSQDCSLIYAPYVEITRLDATVDGKNVKGMELDDIGNYGELYRIPDFLTVQDSTYETSFQTITGTNNEYTLSSALDYARLALAWQSRGYFTTINGINNNNWFKLKSSTITLDDNITLTDFGIGGLTRDVYDSNNPDTDTFTGIFKGNGHTITLDIGDSNSTNDVTYGDGRIYWHNAIGLFAAIDSQATVSNLELEGSIRLSNNKLESTMSCGALAAQVTTSGDAAKSLIDRVSTKVEFDAICSGASGNYILYLGGLFGQISARHKTTINFDNKSNFEPTITITYNKNCTGSYNHFGGAIGVISGNGAVEIECNDATIKGSISNQGSNSPYNMYVGGLIGTIWSGTSTRKIKITDLEVNGFTYTGSASQRMGGILGGIWADTDVIIDSLNVIDTTLTASDAAELGGLVYRASGKWTVSSIDLSGLIISAGSSKALGLLVCHGESYKEPVNATTLNTNVDALYLEMTEHWDWDADSVNGYSVPSSITFGKDVFDEFVAYTAYRYSDDSYDITHNGGGIISLKTANNTVNMEVSERNTYVNRTGVVTTTNKYSRYYYNLPTVLQSISIPTAEPEAQAETTNRIDTANELLIWSVYRYAATNLKQYFMFSGVADNDGKAVPNIGGTSEGHADFDMNGLSYYPINITDENVIVQYADVKFYNEDIEKNEITYPENKSTRGTSEDHSQHYTMHCALFLNFTSENITANADYEMVVNGVNLAGTVGVVNGGSGALLCGTVHGESISGNTATCTVILADADDSTKAVSLNGLSITPVGDYTPVLINKIGTYAGLKANYVTTTYQPTMTAGSSLIGDVGGEKAKSVNIEFVGTIKLPDEDDSKVFTKATLLNSLRYENGSATYHFFKEKEYPSDGEYQHNATYGEELSTTVEYVNKQGCYNDGFGEEYYIKEGVFSETGFSAYLPYVACSPATSEEDYPLSEKWHELAVNVLYFNLTDGCGTYGHPYQINSDNFNLLIDAASYINTGKAANGWKITISDNSVYHTDVNDNEIVLTYTEGVWTQKDGTPYEGNIQQYLASAYYQINDDITLTHFDGIGTDGSGGGLPFTGVITGKKKADDIYATVTLSGGSSAFINYSYGSVVRDLNIVLNQSLSLKWVSQQTTSATRVAEQSPKTFFGGVIGCVLGGDNIIENVSVSGGKSVSVDDTNQKAHLVPVGGYIGVIAGGGVIFRGTCSNSSSITGSSDGKYLYRNSIIGRVLGGYAFYEGNTTVPNNGDNEQNQDYKINKLNIYEEKSLTWNDTDKILTVNNAQGLLILSAIVSSGAGSTESNAYKNGVARNAKYDHIGETADSASSDFALSNSDTVGSVPYLLKHYADCTTLGDICAKSNETDGIVIKFKNDSFDMSSYRNGYRGLSARYVSNAAFNGSTVTPSAVVLRVKTFDGQDAIVDNINMDVKEYDNDDFHMASMGGIFNIVWTQKQSGGGGVGSNFAQNLTLTNCNVSLKYVDRNGDPKNQADSDTLSDVDGLYSVSVGGFIGMVNDIEALQDSINHNYLFTKIHIKGNENKKCQIYGPNGAGGLIGTTAMASTGVTGYPGKLLANGKWALFGPNFLNCSYSHIEVTAGMAAGGLIGDAYASGSSNVPGFSVLGISYGNKAFLCYASCTVTDEQLIVGASSTIKARAKGSIAAGIFGAAGMRVGVNDPDVAKADKTALPIAGSFQSLKLSNVEILVSQEDFKGSNPDGDVNNAYAGGIIARIGSENPVCFYDVDIQGGKVSSSLATSSYVGGIVGSGYTNKTDTMERCSISLIKIEGVYAGGFLGRGLGAPNFELHMSDCKLTNSQVTGQTDKNSYAGGVVGNAASKYYLHNILLKNVSISAKKGAGRLFGLMNFNAAGDDFKVYAAGVSIYADDPNVIVPQMEGYDGGKNYTGYIAYADYAGTEMKVANKKAPYVTVNPNFLLNTSKAIYGDAVGKIQDDTSGSVAARIWADNKTGATGKKNLASYAKASAIVNTAGKSTPEVSTFREVQGYTVADWGKKEDLPVLVLKGNDSSAIEDYLNVITNGGYEKANVMPTVTVYYFNKDEKTFSLATDQQLKENSASIYYENNQFHIRSRTFDNTLNRFSLVEASFTVKVNGEDRTYTVSVPVVVIRELQFDFMATFSYGREFKKSIFDNLRTHLLESTGNPFTAYLTYQYNREKGQYMEYDWQTYMDDGGSMLDVDKVLSFSSGLPTGTQMILVDCQNGNQAYQYTTSEQSTKDVKFGNFTSLADGKTPFQSSMAETLGVTSVRSDSGKYVMETDKTKATVRLKEAGTYVYYRLATDSDVNMTRFELTVPDLSQQAPEENYYLIITVPNPEGNPNYYINGSLSSSLNWTMPSSGTQLHRYDPTQVDKRNNTESTYQISTGYRQELVSTASVNTVDLGNIDQKMQVKVQDTITFSNGQTYDENDKLFLKLTVNLQEHTTGPPDVEEKQFPVGTTGTVKFYVQNGEKTTYFTWDGTQWFSQSSEVVAVSYDWASNGGNMELLLSTDGKALDLSGVRQMIKGNNDNGNSQIIVTAEMDIEFGSAEVLNAAVPGSENNGTDTWAQLHYLGQISTQETSLSYSAMRETAKDNAKYYRGVQYQAVLSMDAMQIDQLGVNPLQLVADYQENINGKNASHIDLTAALNLANLQDIESVLQDTESITFKLSLQRRNQAEYVDATNASAYIGFDKGTFDSGKNIWSWTIPKDQYYNNGAIVMNDIFDGTQFTIPITAYVFTDQKDYANYKIKLTVFFNGRIVDVSESDACVIYTFACIKPSFYEPTPTQEGEVP